jgi:cyclophilin family peptidyl-prolyl cis-trans isomerase
MCARPESRTCRVCRRVDSSPHSSPPAPPPAPCARSKHTIFGRVTKGWDALRAIETAKTDKHDHPLEEIKVLSVTVR